MINLVEKLKNCPVGTKLYSPLCGEVKFDGIQPSANYPIRTVYKFRSVHREKTIFFTKEGKFLCNEDFNGECLLFPSKNNHDWNSVTFEPKPWRNSEDQKISGYWINLSCNISHQQDVPVRQDNKDVFATKKQAKSALAMAQISQIIVNDKRFGGPITDEEWENNETKYCIVRKKNSACGDNYSCLYSFLAFHTPEQRDLFFKENEDLVKDYLMID